MIIYIEYTQLFVQGTYATLLEGDDQSKRNAGDRLKILSDKCYKQSGDNKYEKIDPEIKIHRVGDKRCLVECSYNDGNKIYIDSKKLTRYCGYETASGYSPTFTYFQTDKSRLYPARFTEAEQLYPIQYLEEIEPIISSCFIFIGKQVIYPNTWLWPRHQLKYQDNQEPQFIEIQSQTEDADILNIIKSDPKAIEQVEYAIKPTCYIWARIKSAPHRIGFVPCYGSICNRDDNIDISTLLERAKDSKIQC